MYRGYVLFWFSVSLAIHVLISELLRVYPSLYTKTTRKSTVYVKVRYAAVYYTAPHPPPSPPPTLGTSLICRSVVRIDTRIPVNHDEARLRFVLCASAALSPKILYFAA